mgnify:CR=1 FL=1
MTESDFHARVAELREDPLATLPGCVVLEMVAWAQAHPAGVPVAYMVSGPQLVRPHFVPTEKEARAIAALGMEGTAVTELVASKTTVFYVLNGEVQ